MLRGIEGSSQGINQSLDGDPEVVLLTPDQVLFCSNAMKRKIQKVSDCMKEHSSKPSPKWFKRRKVVAPEVESASETPTIRLNSLVPITEDSSIMAVYEEDESRGMASIFQKYWKRVMGSALRYLGDRDEAQDAVSEIFLKVMDKLKRDRPRHFGSWLFMVARNHCIEQLRKKKRRPEQESIENFKLMWVVEEEEDTDFRQRRNHQVRAAMAQLPEGQRMCLELMCIEGLTYKEISEETGMDMKAVKSHIQNGKRRLILALGKQIGESTGSKKAS